MEYFEYQITSHGAEEFTRMIYFCSADGDCGLEEVPADEPEALTEVEGVRDVRIDLERGEASFEDDPSVDLDTVKKAVEKAGYRIG